MAKGELLSPGIFKMEYIDGESFDVRCMQYFKIGDFEGFIQNIVYYYQHMLADYTNDVLSVKDFNPYEWDNYECMLIYDAESRPTTAKEMYQYLLDCGKSPKQFIKELKSMYGIDIHSTAA